MSATESERREVSEEVLVAADWLEDAASALMNEGFERAAAVLRKVDSSYRSVIGLGQVFDVANGDRGEVSTAHQPIKWSDAVLRKAGWSMLMEQSNMVQSVSNRRNKPCPS